MRVGAVLVVVGAPIPRWSGALPRPWIEAVMAAKFEIFTDSENRYRFHLKAANGEIIAQSQGCESRNRRRRASPRCRPTRPAAAVVDLTDK